MVHATSRKQAPNHEVDYLFSCLIQVSTNSFELGHNISSDKKYASFQGHNEEKYRVTFKRAGDGFLIDAGCEDGYTISFYPSNPPPPKKWIEKGYSPTHSQIIFMSDALPDQYYTCGMDNVFVSAKFLQVAYAETKYKTMVHGVS